MSHMIKGRTEDLLHVFHHTLSSSASERGALNFFIHLTEVVKLNSPAPSGHRSAAATVAFLTQNKKHAGQKGICCEILIFRRGMGGFLTRRTRTTGAALFCGPEVLVLL